MVYAKIVVIFLLCSTMIGGLMSVAKILPTSNDSGVKSCTSEEFTSMLEINDDIVGKWIVESVIVKQVDPVLTDNEELVGMTLEIMKDGKYLFNDELATLERFKTIESAWDWGALHNYPPEQIERVLGDGELFHGELFYFALNNNLGVFISANGIFFHNNEAFARNGLYNLVRIE